MATVNARVNKDGITTSYQIKVWIGKDSSGRNIFESKSFKVPSGMKEEKAKKLAHEEAIIFEKGIKEGTISNCNERFDQYSEYVLNHKESMGELKRSTIERYRGLAKRVNEAIGHLKLKDIKATHLNQFYLHLQTEDKNKSTGKPLSPTTIKRYHEYISSILEFAFEEEKVVSNVCRKAKLPKCEQKEMEKFDYDQVEMIQNAIQDQPIKWKALITVLLSTGVRRGELLGLTWDCVDYESNKITINKTINQSLESGLYEDSPKTKYGYREIAIPQTTTRLLKEYEKWQKSERLRLGEYYENNNFVFTQSNGNPMSPDSISAYCRKVLSKRCGFKVNPHKFRHTQASMLIDKGLSIPSVSRRLGHSMISTTMNFYTHSYDEKDKESAEVLENVLFK